VPDLPLALRPVSPTAASKPLTLATEPSPTPWPYKLAFGGALLAACALVWKKRRALATRRAPHSTPVTILGKTSMGLRGELALVEVGGMRLLVGVTASSMQTLAVLPDDFAEAAEEARETEAAAAPAAESRRPAPRESLAVPTRRASDKADLASRARALCAPLDGGPPIPARVAASGFAASRYADERDSDSDSVPESAPAPATRTRSRRPTPRAASRDLPLEGQARGIALALGNRSK
jgi:flagellar biogenesis protein FliO